MRKKILKNIPEFPDYSITKDGCVWSTKRGKGKWLHPSEDAKGYLHVILYKNYKHYPRKIHRLVLETYVGKRPKDMECRHLDGNKKNNKLSNLCWGTAAENSKDAIRHGTLPGFKIKGEDVNSAKLTEQNVELIIDSYYDGARSIKELANHFGVIYGTIWNIVHKKTWKHIWSQKGGDTTNKEPCVA